MVMPMTSIGSASTPARAAGRKRSRVTPPGADDQLEQLLFLHEVARLATTARTWDELLETVVDRTRDVLHADVSSLYLLDRDGAYLTLAATNGLDRFQIGRARVRRGRDRAGRRRAQAAGDFRRARR
jgi:GAF domain-containing protein